MARVDAGCDSPLAGRRGSCREPEGLDDALHGPLLSLGGRQVVLVDQVQGVHVAEQISGLAL